MNEFLSNRCRACSEQQQECSTKMISLFEKSLSEMFTNCTSLKITINDNLPSHLCNECFEQLSNFNKFRETCANSDAYFREQIVAESIKDEPLDMIKYEENESNREIKSELYETEYIDESFEQYDSESNNQSSTESPDFSNHSNPFDGTKYICDYCGKVTSKKSHIGSHMTKHRNEMIMKSRPKQFPCTSERCGKVFESRKLYDDHKLSVHKIKPQRASKIATEIVKKAKLCCPQCPKWFTVQHKLDGHIRSKHEGLKPYKCTQCEKGFSKYGAYTHHLRFSHNAPLSAEIREYRCNHDGCDRVYGLMDSLKAHINRAHLGIIPERRDQKLICDQCGRSFIDGHSLKKHIYTHTGKLPFPCKICTKSFLTNHQLKMHTMRHLKIKPFECPTCGARKTTNKELEAHLNFHSKAISYPCKECDRVFTSYAAQSRHVRIHHRNHKPYICPHCDKAFAKAETMKNHVMTHTGEKPFACPVCDHRFIQAVAMRTHMKVHENK